MRAFLQSKITVLASAAIRRQRPTVIGVTGSVGKTSAKRAIATVLESRGSVRAAPYNYNNEIGLPVSIIGGIAPGRSFLSWLALVCRGQRLAWFRSSRYPKTLILEYGADHPGDLAHLIRIARPQIAVVTAVGPAHTEFFGSVEQVIAEKRTLVEAVPREGLVVLNCDDENVYDMRERAGARVVTYGFRDDADVRAIEYQVTQQVGMPTGITFKIRAQGSVVPVHLVGCLGTGHASAALVAAAVGLHNGMNLVAISKALGQYIPAPSRLRMLSGIKQTIIIDDSYNASPLAMAVALEAAASLPVRGRRFAVLGDMLELGSMTEHEHLHVGELVTAKAFDYLVCVGEASRHIASGARSAGMPADRVLEFAQSPEAGRFVQNLIRPGDLVLIKGSQGIRMEKIVVELMADPLRKKDLVCRQEGKWMEH